MTRTLAVAAVGVCVWCLIVMAMGVSNAHSVWEWIWTLLFGAVAPVVLLRLVAGVLTTYERGQTGSAQEARVLQALSDGGALTAAAVAARTSLALDDVASRLDSMAARGHLDMRLDDGVERYALAGELRDAP